MRALAKLQNSPNIEVFLAVTCLEEAEVAINLQRATPTSHPLRRVCDKQSRPW
jgi:hypothetical protein